MTKKEIFKRIAELQGCVAAQELPASVKAELLARHKAKSYTTRDCVPMRYRAGESAKVRVAVTHTVTPTKERTRLEAQLAKLLAKLGK